MADFKTFKRRRLREDPTASNYNDYQWERAYAAYCSARGISLPKPDAESKGKPNSDEAKEDADSGAPRQAVLGPRGGSLRPLAYVSMTAAFFFAVLLGFVVPYAFGVDVVIGFLLGATFFISHACLIFMLLNGLER